MYTILSSTVIRNILNVLGVEEVGEQVPHPRDPKHRDRPPPRQHYHGMRMEHPTQGVLINPPTFGACINHQPPWDCMDRTTQRQ